MSSKFSSNTKFSSLYYFKKSLIPPLIKSNKKLPSYYGVLDIETYTHNNTFHIFSIGFLLNISGKKFTKIFYLWKGESELSLLNRFFKNLNSSIPKNKSLYIYSHNMGNFDGHLLINAIYFNYSNVEVLMDDNSRFIQIKFNNIILKDSLRILPMSLSKLSKNIKNCPEKKNIDYNRFIKDNLFNIDFKRELKSYLNSDLESLYFILTYYFNLFLNYNIDPKNIFSTSHLAFTLFRTNFLKNNLISNVKPALYNIIKKSYYGGLLYFKDQLKISKNLYHYDVNSLYPFAMLNPMPNKYLKFHNSLNLDLFLKLNLFGFFYCKVNSLNNISLVPSRDINNKISYNNISEGLYFSEEIKSWINLGYEVEVYYGYEYTKSDNLFKEYINHFYKFKSNSKNSQDKLFYKLMLNGLYGYFSRKPIRDLCKQVTSKELEFYATYYNIKFIIDLDNGNHLIKYTPLLNSNLNFNLIKDLLNNNDKSFYENPFKSVKSNIAIGSAITAYARIHMHKFILEKSYNIYYSDTDSIIIDKPLDKKFIGDKIGEFKLENEIKELILLKPKFYSYITKEDKEVITSAGIPKEYLKFQDFKDLYNGKSKDFTIKHITKDISNFKLKYIEHKFSLNIFKS